MQTPVVLGTPVNSNANVAGTAVSLGTFTPGANKPVMVAVLQSTYGGAPNAVTITAGALGLTWTSRTSAVHSDIGSASLTVLTGVGASPTAGELFVNVAAGSSVARTLALAVDMGADGVASPAPIVQVSPTLTEGAESPSDATITGMSALASGSGVIAVFSTPGAASPVFTAQNGFTQLTQLNATDGALAVIYKLAGTNNPRVTTDDDFVRVNGIAFEIKADGSGGTAQDLAGAAAGQATASGSASVTKPLSGGASGQASASGAASVGKPLAGGAAGQATASGQLQGGATITTLALKNDSGTLLTALTIEKLAALRVSDMALVASWTNQATNGSGVLSLNHVGLVAGTVYLLVSCNADGSARGIGRYTAA